MRFISDIVEALGDLAGFFYNIYLEVFDWIYPFNVAAGLFYQVHKLFADLSWSFADFGDWVEEISQDIGQGLSWESIKDYILGWLPGLDDVVAWFSDWRDEVEERIERWWWSAQDTVQAWIDIATAGLDELTANWDYFRTITYPEWTKKLDTLRADWDNFWTITFPTLITVGWLTAWWNTKVQEIDDLIATRVGELVPALDAWQEFGAQVVTFFSDPVEFIWQRFTDWFLGAE